MSALWLQHTVMTVLFIASDLTAFIAYNKRYFIVPEYHILTMTADGITLEDLDGHSVEPEYMEVNWDVTAAQKDGYPHFMIKEIHEQPAAITRTITPRIKRYASGFFGRCHCGFLL